MGADDQQSHRDRDAEIQRVVNDCVARRARGEVISNADVEAMYQQLAPELGRQLQLASIVASAREKADSSINSDTFSVASEKAPTHNSEATRHPVGADRNDANRYPAFVGRFELIEQLGQGGFATVWKAHDPHLDRWVAVKVPRNADLSASEAELFLREARSASQVRHPNVVHLHEVGRDGYLIYLVTDLIDGQPLSEWVENRSRTHRQSAELCETISRALDAIHEAGIVHRDLKPANILIDQSGNPFIADFGLAKRGGAEATLTLDGQMMGTPAYMSPEQASGQSNQANIGSDLYSLGVILYELLTGGPPFRGSPHQVLAQTMGNDPPKPRTIDPSIPRDLETLCLRCLEKDPDRRFRSAKELADDLGRFLRNEPIHSRPIGNLRRATRWCRRNRSTASLIGVMALAAVLGSIAALREHRLSQQALAAKQEAEAQKVIATDNERRARRSRYAANMLLVQDALTKRNPLLARQLLEEHLPAPNLEDHRGFEWRYLWNLCHNGLIGTIEVDEPIHCLCVSDDGRFAAASLNRTTVIIDLEKEELVATNRGIGAQAKSALHFGQDSNRLFLIGHEGNLVWWDSIGDDSPQQVSTNQVLRAIARLPHGAGWVTGGDDGVIQIWTNHPDRPNRTIQLPDNLQCRELAASPNGESIVVVGWANPKENWKSELFCFDVGTGDVRWRRVFPSASVATASFSVDGRLIALSGPPVGGAPRLVDPETGETVGELEPQKDSIAQIALSPDCAMLAGFATHTGNVVLWDVESGEMEGQALPHLGISCAAWRDAKTLITGGTDGCLRIWSVNAPPPQQVLSGSSGDVFWFSTSTPDGSAVLTYSSSDDAELWDVKNQRSQQLFSGPLLRPIVLPEGRAILAMDPSEKEVWRRHADSPDSSRRVYGTDSNGPIVRARAISHSGRWLALGERDRREETEGHYDVIVIDLHKHQELCRIPIQPYGVGHLQFTRDEKSLIIVDFDNHLRCWNLASQSFTSEVDRVIDEGYITSTVCHPYQPLVAIGNQLGEVRIVDFSSGSVVRSFYSYGNRVNAVTFSPDGHTVIAACGNFSTQEEVQGEVRFWDIYSGHTIASFGSELGVPTGVAMTLDGRQLVTTHFDAQISIWDGTEPSESSQQR